MLGTIAGEAVGPGYEIESPSMCSVFPSADDEGTAEENKESEMDPDLTLAAQIEWESAKEFGESTPGFSLWYVRNWACDSLCGVLQTDTEKTLATLSRWLEAAEDTPKKHNGPNALAAIQYTVNFVTSLRHSLRR